MSLSLTVNITGTRAEIAKLNRLGSSLQDFSGAMRTIGDQLVKYYSGQAFASQGGVFGEVWAALNPVYARRKAVGNTKRQPLGKGAFPGRGVLVATGQMQNSFYSQSSSTDVYVSNDDPVFKYHQSSEPRTIMPYRPMIKVNDDVRNIVKQVIQEDISQKLASL